jgi:hypothetical protein
MVQPPYLYQLLDDIWCLQNQTTWECPLLPDWAAHTHFVCNNSTCIEHCALHVTADLKQYLLYAGSIIILSTIIVHMMKFYKRKLFKKTF